MKQIKFTCAVEFNNRHIRIELSYVSRMKPYLFLKLVIKTTTKNPINTSIRKTLWSQIELIKAMQSIDQS